MRETEYDIIYSAEDTYWWYVGLHELIEYCVGKIQETENRALDILDCGCGTGRLLILLSMYGSVRGIDYSRKAVEYCRNRGLSTVERGDLNSCELGASLYDIITSMDVLYHSAIIDDIGVIEKIHAALKPGGLFILNLPAFEYLRRNHDIVVGGKRRYRRNRLNEQLRRIGFDIEMSTYRLAFMFIPILIKKYAEKILGSDQPESDIHTLRRTVNRIMLAVNRLENRVLRSGLSLSFGTSLFIVAMKVK